MTGLSVKSTKSACFVLLKPEISVKSTKSGLFVLSRQNFDCLVFKSDA